MRQLSRLLKTKTAVKQPPPLTVDALRKQLPHMSPEDRETTQRLLANESALKKALSESDSFDQPKSMTDLITQVLENAQSPQDLGLPFWSSVKELIKETSGRRNVDARVENIPLFVRLFQLAKDLQEPQRSQLLYQTGSYIYRLKMLRFDPVNEAEYLDALARYSQPIQAVTLWRSRKDRDEVANSVYWWDIGVLYHLEANLVKSANELALTMLEKFDYVSPRALCQLILATRDEETRVFWLNCLINAKPVKESDDFMQKQNLEPEHLQSLFKSLVSNQKWTLATMLVEQADFAPNLDVLDFRGKNEGSIAALAAALTEKNVSVMKDPAFFAFWALGSIRQGMPQEAPIVLGGAQQMGIKFTESQVVKLITGLLKHSMSDEAQNLANEYDTPAVAIVYLNYLSKHDQQAIASYINSINCDLTPELAEKVLEVGGQSEYPLLDLALSHGCWKQLWKLLREGAPLALGEVPSTRSALQTMFTSGNYQPSLNLFETVLQACVINGDSLSAIAVLAYMQQKNELYPNLLLFSSIKAARGPKSHKLKTSKTVQGDIAWPTTGPLAQHISLEKIAKYLAVDLNDAKALAETWP